MNESEQKVADLIRSFSEINYILILSILVISVLMNWAIQQVLPWIAERLPARFRLYILPLVPILRLLILFLGISLLLPEILNFSAISPENVLAFLGAAAVALGFAFKDWVSSIIAGVVALYERPYRAGDWVEIDGDYGEVKQVGMRAIKIVTPDDTVITIPHQKLWNSNIANANDGNREHMVVADFYLHPNHDARLVRQKLWDVAVTSPYTHLSQPILVIVREKPWGTHYQLKAYPIDGRDQFLYLSDLTVRGKAVIAEMKIAPAQVMVAVSAADYGA